MQTNILQFNDKHDLSEITILLMQLNNIGIGRELVWLLNDTRARNNQEAIEHWLRSEVWRRQTSKERITLNDLSEALLDRLNAALFEAQG